MRIVLILTMLAVPSLADAQQRDWVFGIGVGVTGNQPEAFDSRSWYGREIEECAIKSEEFVSASVGRRVNRWLRLDAMVSFQAGAGAACTQLTLQLPPPYVLSEYVGKTVGSDYAAVTLRSVIEPGAATVRARGVIGLGYIPAKDMTQLQLGAGISAGRKRTRFTAELGFLMPRVKWTRRFEDHQSETVVVETTETGTSTPRRWYGRVGVEF